MKVAMAFEPIRTRPYRRVLERIGRLAKEVGVRRVEVSLPDPEEEWGETEGLPHWVEAEGLEPICLCLGLRMPLSSAAERRKALRGLRRAVELAGALGVKVLRVRPLGSEGEAFEEVFGPTSDLFSLAVLGAAEEGVIMAVENGPACARTSAQLRRLIDKVASPFFRSSLDLAEFEQCGEDVLTAVQNLAPFSVHVRLAGPWASMEGVDPPPTLRGVARALHIAGYRGHLAVVGREGQNVDELRRAVDLVKAAIDLAPQPLACDGRDR